MTPRHSPPFADRGRIARAPVATTSGCMDRAAEFANAVICQPRALPRQGDVRSMSELETSSSFEVTA